jgi:hypothetical protein
MAVVANSRVYIEAPTSTLPRYGLFSVANGPLPIPDQHAEGGGLEWETGLCELPYGYAIDCADLTPVAKTFDDGPTVVNADPFVLVSSLVCGSLGMDEARLRRVLGERLDAGAQGAIENIFSRELFGQAPGLATATGVATLTAAANIAAGIGALESWLYARYGPAGVIHIPAAYAHQVQQTGGLRWDGRKWVTAMGTGVSFGNYAGTTPLDAAPAAGHTTFYITGQVTIWQSPNTFITPLEAALNISTNQVNGYAERIYLLGYDCFVAGVDVTL